MNDLEKYNLALRNIKFHNIPAMAARMANTILCLPRHYMDRQIKDSRGNVLEDHSGQVIDSYWDEIVGRAIAKVDGVYRSDVPNIISLVIALNQHLVKWQYRYMKTIATSALTSAHNEFVSQWRDVFSKADNVKKNDVRTTYLGLGFNLDQKSLNDNPQFHDDTYTMLIEVSTTPLQDAVASTLMVEHSLSKTLPQAIEIGTIVRKTMLLLEAVATLIHDMNWIIEGMAPVLRYGSKRDDFKEPIVTYNNIHSFDPELIDGVNKVDAKDVSISGNLVTVSYPDYRCRISVIVNNGWRVESLTVDGKEVEYTNIQNSSKAIYLSEKTNSEENKIIVLSMGHRSEGVSISASNIKVFFVPEQ